MQIYLYPIQRELCENRSKIIATTDLRTYSYNTLEVCGALIYLNQFLYSGHGSELCLELTYLFLVLFKYTHEYTK